MTSSRVIPPIPAELEEALQRGREACTPNLLQMPNLRELEVASVAEISELAREWVNSRGLKISNLPSCRFPIIIDEEVFQISL